MSNVTEYFTTQDAPAAPIARYGVKQGWRAQSILAEMLAEYLGCFVLVCFGDGVVAVAVAGLTQSGRTNVIFAGAGGWLLITWGWAMSVAMAVYVAGGVSGAHLNPAVSLGFAIKGDFPWKKLVPYWAAQVAGCFTGGALVLLNYFGAINAWNLANHVADRAADKSGVTFSIFATTAAAYYGGDMLGPFIDQVIGTFFLMLFVLAIIDATNTGPGSNMAPFLIGMGVAAIGMSFGTGAGYAINPARDFGPRLLAWIAGWGPNAFPAGGYWWVPILGPLAGGALAVPAYGWFISETLIARTPDPHPAGRTGRAD